MENQGINVIKKKAFIVLLLFCSFLLVSNDQEQQNMKNYVFLESCDLNCFSNKKVDEIQNVCVCEIVINYQDSKRDVNVTSNF